MHLSFGRPGRVLSSLKARLHPSPATLSPIYLRHPICEANCSSPAFIAQAATMRDARSHCDLEYLRKNRRTRSTTDCRDNKPSYAIYRHPLRPNQPHAIIRNLEQENYESRLATGVPKAIAGPSHLLALPFEVRHRILEYLFSQSELYFEKRGMMKGQQTWRMKFRRAETSVLKVCKTLLNEGLPILEDKTVAVFSDELACSSRIFHHLVNWGHSQQLFQFTRHIQLPNVSLADLADIDLKDYSCLKSVKLTLLPAEGTFNGKRHSQLTAADIQQQWAKNPEEYLKVGRPPLSVTVQYTRFRDFLAERDAYVCVIDHLPGRVPISVKYVV